MKFYNTVYNNEAEIYNLIFFKSLIEKEHPAMLFLQLARVRCIQIGFDISILDLGRGKRIKMVVGLVTRTASQAGRTASRQIARRKASSQVYNPPEKYNLPDVDDTFLNPHKVSSSL